MINEIKDRPSPHWDIQKEADYQTRIVAFSGFDPESNVGNSREKREVGNPQPILKIFSGKQTESGKDDPNQDDVDIEDEILVNGLVFGVELQDVDVEKSAKATREDVLFGFVDHV